MENEETRLERPLENQQYLIETNMDMTMSWPTNVQICYYMDMQTGLLYYLFSLNQTFEYYQ